MRGPGVRRSHADDPSFRRTVERRIGYGLTPETAKVPGPGDSFGFQIVAGEDSGPGARMYHCHVQSHSDLGMSGIFLVRNPDGTVPSHARRALDKWSHGAH